jgi:DNA excision repair protein ERCC-2
MGESGGKAVLVSYIWGTLSEGIDYRDGRGRTVIIVGVGYPALNDRMNAVESAYDHTFGYGAGWEFAVQVPTIRKIRQAMGRVVRSPVDYGVRILLDGRFTTEAPKKFGKFSVFEMFPDDERDEFIDVDPEKVKYSLMNFFQDNSEK